MALNKSKGQMYPWISHTWNPIRGRCPHECSYCYMKDRPVGELRLDRKSLADDLSKATTIFVGSSTDMWTFNTPLSQIEAVMDKCWRNPEVKFVFQSKNPARFFHSGLPDNSLIGTTIETNRSTELISKAPDPVERAAMMYNRKPEIVTFDRFVSIEPIMDFDLDQMIEWMELWIKPDFVSIGADSKGHKLPEPPAGKIRELIQELQRFTEVKIKKNLNRLLID